MLLILARVSPSSYPNTLSQMPAPLSFLLELASPILAKRLELCDASASLTEAAAIYEARGTLSDQHLHGAQVIIWKALISPAVRRPKPTDTFPSNPGGGRIPLLSSVVPDGLLNGGDRKLAGRLSDPHRRADPMPYGIKCRMTVSTQDQESSQVCTDKGRHVLPQISAVVGAPCSRCRRATRGNSRILTLLLRRWTRCIHCVAWRNTFLRRNGIPPLSSLAFWP
ncbi:hypothetical protein DFH08DRAFT_271879 [Mycena albidolilacea]|uniref:Uncharacterized protein n=1 Tax=Mycena albidolilacea TaxID=1033008 RepID=A0AAD7ANW2_9AGAR|nr:hypothetical protein DFH08DRAFT_271879 [Mycena albidolilacea]